MDTKVFNFTSFTEDKKVNTAILDKRSSPEAKRHPEYGILPYNAQCDECIELIDQRTQFTRFYIDPLHLGHSYTQQSYFPLHYRDAAGQWRSIDHRLRPSDTRGVFVAAYQPLPVTFDFQHDYVSIDLHDFRFLHDRDLKMYYATDPHDPAGTPLSGDYSHYTVGDDGARIYNMWPGIDMEAFAMEAKTETNFIFTSRPQLPATGYIIIEDHVNVPDGYTLTKAGGTIRLSNQDLLLKDKVGNIKIQMDHVRIHNADNVAIVTDYMIQKEADGYTVRIVVPVSFLNVNESSYPIVVDPVVIGADSLGNFNSSGRPSAGMNFTSLPGHCDYHMTVTVPGMSQLQSAKIDLEATTSDNTACGDTLTSDHGAFGHVCLKRDILFTLRCDTCNIFENYSCFHSTNCDTPGTLTTDPRVVSNGGPIPIPFTPFLSCLPPQCPDYQLGFTLENSDSSCEDQCGQLCAIGNMWRMTIEACQIDAYLTTTDSLVCAGQTTTIVCHPSCGVPPYHYLWSTGDTTQSISISPPSVGIDVACTAYDACNNPVALAPDIVINQIPSPPADAGPGAKVCEGGSITLGGSPTTSGSATVSWSASSAQALAWISDTTAANPTLTIPHGIIDTTFYIVRTYDGTCFSLDTAYVYSLPDPTATIDTSGATRICNGQSVTLQANGPFSSYLWSTGSTSQSITVSTPGSYYVVVTDANNCRDTSASVVISTISIPTIHVYPDTTIFYGDSVVLYSDISLTPAAVDSFFWSPDDSSITCIKCPNPTVSPLNQEAYFLTVYTQGCKLSDSALISVILPDNYYIPNAFTPNGDGVNDYFFLYGQSGVTVHSFKVFDRWGEKVYDGLFPWDGTYKGQLCQPGVYVYIFSIGLFGHLEDDHRKGSVTLIR